MNTSAPAAGLSLRTIVCLGGGLGLLGLLFPAEIATAIQTWSVSTAYNHCFLVLPIVAYLIWDRKAELQGLRAEPMPLIGLLGIPLAFVWLIAERLGIMEGRQLVAVTFLEILLFAVLGRRLWWAVSGPLLYLYFLVPFGEFLVPKLQDVTAVFIRNGMALTDIPTFIDGYTIEIPAGTFYVAEACAGLRFLIASIAFGVLYALMMYRSPVRRTVFIVASIIIPVIANGFRALGIVLLGHYLGSAQAAAADHVIYGWVFFSAVILVLIAIGLPFREDEIKLSSATLPAWPDLNPIGGNRGVVAIGILVVVAAISPILAFGLNASNTAPAAAIEPLDPGVGCVTVAAKPSNSHTGLASTLVQRIACGPVEYDLRIATFSPRSTAAPVMAERRRLSRVIEAEDTTETWLPSSMGDLPAWRMVRSNHPAFSLAVAVWVDGLPVRPGMAMRARMAVTSLLGGQLAPVVVSVAPAQDWATLSPEEQRRSDHALSEFLLSHPDINQQIARLAGHGR